MASDELVVVIVRVVNVLVECVEVGSWEKREQEGEELLPLQLTTPFWLFK